MNLMNHLDQMNLQLLELHLYLKYHLSLSYQMSHLNQQLLVHLLLLEHQQHLVLL